MSVVAGSRPAVVGLDFVTTDPAVRAAVATDRSGLPGEVPAAVARPRTVADVQDLLRIASFQRVHVIPRGAGSGLAGGAVATADSVVLDLSGLNRILEIDPVNRFARVEPGVITAHLDREAARHGLRYAPDPASAELSTIGGNIATNAGGLRCVKHGVTRDAVRSLDVVLADGRLLNTRAATVKNVTGYDLTGLFVGSEGTLGVIVGATLALTPIPATTATLQAGFGSLPDAAAAVAAILATGVRPAVAELMDAHTLEAIDAHLGTSLRAKGEALLILQTEGHAAGAEIDAVRAAVSGLATAVWVSTDAEGAEQLLRARKAALPAIERFGKPYIEDIAVPLSRLAEAFHRIGEIAAAHDVPIFTFAHAGDGNIHPLIVATDGDPATSARVHAAADDVFALALELGGTVTGEHGVGRLKREWASRELDPAAIDLQRALRSAFDPLGILNPGAAL